MSSTDTNQASEELREMFKAFVDSGYHACYCARSLDNGCECAIKDEYIDKVMTAIQSIIRTEKIKLLAAVRERVIGKKKDQEYRLIDTEYASTRKEKVYLSDGISRNKLRSEQIDALNKLEAEL